MRRQKMQKQHLLGAGFIATLVAIYPFAANLGVVPQDATQLIKLPPGMSSITLPNGTQISLTELQQQVQNNPNLAGVVNNLLQQYNASNGTNYSLPNFGNGYGNAPGTNSNGFGFGQGTNPSGYGAPQYGQNAFGNNSFGNNSFGNNSFGNNSLGNTAYGNNSFGGNPPAFPSTYGTPGGYAPNQGSTHLTSYGNGGGTAYSADVSFRSFVNGNCTQVIVDEIQRAQSKIFIQSSSFTSKPIADALIEASRRHIEVYVILDRTAKMENYSQATYLNQYGVPVLFSEQSSASKFMLVDGTTVLSCHFNFTNQAETANAELMMISRNRPDIYQSFENTFQQAYQRVAGLGMSQRTGAVDYGGMSRVANNPYATPGYSNPVTYGNNQTPSSGFRGNGFGTNNPGIPFPSTSPNSYRANFPR